MQQAVYEFVRLCADTLPINPPIFEFGAYQAQGGPYDDLRPLFPDKDYVGSDMRPGPGVDRVLDLHAIDLPDNSVGTVLSLDTLEHVEYPRKAMSEIHRVLKEDGVAILSTVFEFPIHGYPNDFWRFTPNGMKSLLKEFAFSSVGAIGRGPTTPQVIVGVGFKGAPPELARFEKSYAKWERWNNAVIAKMISE